MSDHNVYQFTEEVKPIGEITQREIDARVGALIATGLARTLQDAEDAVAFGLEQACRHWKADAPMWAYAWTVAKHKLIEQRRRKENKQLKFSDIDHGGDGSAIDAIAYHRAPNPESIYADRGIDETLLDCIRNRVTAKSDWKLRSQRRSRSPKLSARTIQILDVFAQSARQDQGVGVDEFDNRSEHRRQYHDYKNERGQILETLCAEHQVSRQVVSECMKTLREETAKALKERNADYNHPDPRERR